MHKLLIRHSVFSLLLGWTMNEEHNYFDSSKAARSYEQRRVKGQKCFSIFKPFSCNWNKRSVDGLTCMVTLDTEYTID